MDEVDWVTRTLLDRRDDIGGIQVFLFGSVERQEPPYSDLDLLVIYRTMTELRKAQSILEKLNLEFPLDVIYMYPEEEKEVGFIDGQSCKRIFPQGITS